MAKEVKVTTVRLRNSNSGAVVNVAEDKVERLGAEWVSADKAPAKKTAAKK